MKRSWVVIPILLLPWALAQGCRTATQVTLDIRTDVKCIDLQGVDIIATASTDKAENLAGYNVTRTRSSTTTASTCTSIGGNINQVGTLVVTPDGDRAAIVVVAGVGVPSETCVPPEYGPNCIVARRSFAFDDHHSATLPILLEFDCKGVPCNALSTCSGGTCVSSEVECTGDECKASKPDASVDGAPPAPIDGSPPSPYDAAPDANDDDASTDAGSDADSGEGNMEAGLDGGAGGDGGITQGSCSPINQCLLGQGSCTYVAGDNQLCCYDMASAHCAYGMSPFPVCNGPAGCCRKAKDCMGGDVCCANTPIPRASTRYSCVPLAGCPIPQQVCENPMTAGECLGGLGCSNMPWQPLSTGATLYRCQ